MAISLSITAIISKKVTEFVIYRFYFLSTSIGDNSKTHLLHYLVNLALETNIFDCWQNNMWRKRGIAIVPCKYDITYFPLPNYCHISVYEGDGTISVSTGGVEMGQGLNTKVAQAVSKELNIPMVKYQCIDLCFRYLNLQLK